MGLTVLVWIDIVAILVHYQPSYNTYTIKTSDLLLLADVPLCCGIYPADKNYIFLHLAITGFHQSDHTVGKPCANMVHCVVKH